MIHIFHHLALDLFGAECLGRLDGFLKDIAEPDLELHRFLWAGPGPAPSEKSFWNTAYPVWDETLVLQEVPEGSVEPGKVDSGRIASGIASTEGLGARIRELVGSLPRELVGANLEHRVHLVIVGSLADPDSSARLDGLLEGLSALRRIGTYTEPASVFLGIGYLAGQGSMASPPEPEEALRVLAGRNLEALARRFAASADVHTIAVPVHVSGEEPIGSSNPDRPTQVAVASLGILARARRIIAEGDAGDFGRDPLDFGVRGDHKVLNGSREWDPARPFTGFGAYAVHCPGHRLLRLLGAQACADLLGELARQTGFGTLKECRRVDVPEAKARFVKEVVGQIVHGTWSDASNTSRIPWKPDPNKPVALFPLSFIKLLFEPIFGDRSWIRVVDAYGEERLRRIPIEDWGGAILELETVVEHGVVRRRDEQIALVQRRVLMAFLASLDKGMDEVFSRTFREPVDSEPHRIAQVLLGTLDSDLEEERIQLEKHALISPHRRGIDDIGRESVERAKNSLQEALSAVPSPVAVFLRFVPILAATVGAALGLPVDLGPFDTPMYRLLGGLGLGVLVNGILFIGFVSQIRSRILKVFRQWFEQYKLMLEREDDIRRENAYSDLLQQMTDLLKWYFEGTSEKPPMPIAPPNRDEWDDAEGVQSEDILSRQEVLQRFQGQLLTARQSFQDLAIHLKATFQPSGVETVLPEISPNDDQVFDEEYRKLLGFDKNEARTKPDPGPFRDALVRLGRSLGSWSLKHTAIEEGRCDVHPFSVVTHGSDGLQPGQAWRRRFNLPDGEALLDAEIRKESSGFGFLETMVRYLRAHSKDTFSLGPRLAEYLERQNDTVIGRTPLYSRMINRCAATVPQSGEAFVVAVPHGPDDPLADKVAPGGRDGRERLSMRATLRTGMSAEDIIYYPNSDAPSNKIGLAMRAAKGSGTNPKGGKP
jgi:hypothetical protein